jgi:hypothetical protein
MKEFVPVSYSIFRGRLGRYLTASLGLIGLWAPLQLYVIGLNQLEEQTLEVEKSEIATLTDSLTITPIYSHDQFTDH